MVPFILETADDELVIVRHRTNPKFYLIDSVQYEWRWDYDSRQIVMIDLSDFHLSDFENVDGIPDALKYDCEEFFGGEFDNSDAGICNVGVQI